MFVFPAFVSPSAAIVLPLIIVPVFLIALLVWHVRKLNSIDGTLREILKKLNSN